MITYENLTGGCNIYLAGNECNQDVPQPISDVLNRARPVKITIEYIDDTSGQVYQVTQLAEDTRPYVGGKRIS